MFKFKLAILLAGVTAIASLVGLAAIAEAAGGPQGTLTCVDSATNLPLGIYNSQKYALQIGETANCQIIDATDASGLTTTTVIIQSSDLGNASTLGTVTGTTISFSWTAPANGCNTTIVAWLGKSGKHTIESDPGGFGYVDANGNHVTCGTSTGPTLETTPSVTGAFVPVTINDSATLAGGTTSPAISGTITFNLYGPGDTTCSGPVLYTDVVTVNGNGIYTTASGDNPGGYSASASGTYNWIASYSGDGNNVALSGVCGDEAITVPASVFTVSKTITISSSQTCTWDVDKSVDDSSLVLQDGGTATVNYTVDVTKSCGDVVYTGSGSITVSTTDGVTVSSVSDPGADLSCPVFPVTVPAGSTDYEICTYTMPVSNPDTVTNTATVTSLDGVEESNATLDKTVNSTVVIDDCPT